jgi:hypothetical protein
VSGPEALDPVLLREAPLMIEVPTPVETVLRLTPSEVELVRAALRMLRNVLGREEADELEAVKALLERLEKT